MSRAALTRLVGPARRLLVPALSRQVIRPALANLPAPRLGMRFFTSNTPCLAATQPQEVAPTHPAPEILSADDNNFDAVVDLPDNRPVLVDFYANWCAPCKAIAPLLAKVAAEQNIRLVKVDVEEAQAVAGRHDIASLPTVALFRDGKIVDQFLGMRSEKLIKEFLQPHLEQTSPAPAAE